MKAKLIRIASLIFIGCMIVLLIITSYRDLSNVSTPEHFVSKGIIDLSEIKDFNQPVKLDGEWAFYENELIDDSKMINDSNLKDNSKMIDGSKMLGDSEKIFVTVPDEWNDYVATRKDPNSFGYGTFHLKIKLSETLMQQIVGFKIQNIGMSNKVIINGQVISASGKPGIDVASYEMGNVPNYVYYAPDKSELDVLIQVSNFDYSPYSGIVSSILFGPQEVIEKTKGMAFGYELFFLGATIVVGLIFFVLYLFRPKEKYLLYFSLYSLTGVFYILTHGEKIWFHIFVNFDYLFFTKLQYLSAAMSISLFIGYLYTSFPEIFKNKITQVMGLVSLIFYPAILFPLSVQSQVSSIQIVFYLVVILYSVYGCIKGIVVKHSYSLYFVWMIAPTIFMAREVIYLVLGRGEVAIWMILAQLTWILVHSFLIAARLSKTYDLVEAQAKELVRMDQLKDEFLANLSHELKTPLIGVTNTAMLYMEQSEGTLTLTEVSRLSTILDFARRMNRMVNDMTDITKIKEGKLALEISAIQTNKLLLEIATSLDIVYKDKGARIAFDIQDNIPRFAADKDRIKQIIFNLVGYAMRNTKDTIITIGARSDSENVELSVSYHGEQWEIDDWNELFEPFSVQKDSNKGFGLGLSIAKQLTSLMGGTIEMEGMEAGDIRIVVSFPADRSNKNVDRVMSEENQDNAKALASAGEEDQWLIPYIYRREGQSTILLVDESHSNLRLVSDILIHSDYSVIAVDNGAEAIEQIALNLDIDLVLIDYRMQDPSGSEICRKLRENYSRDDLPILMLTTTIHQSDVERALLSGANDFIYKPFQSNELVARVNSLVQIKKSLKLTSSYELAFLHAQIKPHFLYNALNTIVECCETDAHEAGRLIISLSKYLRGTLDFENISSFVSVEKELTLVKAYLDIEMARFENLEVEFDVDEEINISLPPLTLQTLVENAVKHGVTKSMAGGEVKVAVKKIQSGVQFTVRDNGVGMDLDQLDLSDKTARDQNSIGLYNINTRLIKLYGKGLAFESTPGQGTKVSFIIPQGGSL